MTFRPFRRRTGKDAPPVQPVGVGPRSWSDSGVADEVESFLGGRYVDSLVAAGRTVPSWAVLNRLAHADHEELVRLVAGQEAAGASGRRRHAWADQERFLAAHLLVTEGTTPEFLARAQQAALVPVELSLITGGRGERLGAEGVLRAAAEALDRYHADT